MTPSRPDPQAAQVATSISAYERAYRKYERRHPEIFNAIEQARLRAALARAVEAIATAQEGRSRALDLGCGTGNVTAHLVELGLDVVAADVSPRFLSVVARRFGAEAGVETLELNGIDLAGIEDESLDLVAAYSVLHHIPDYLAILDELTRVLRPGGVIYIDHEANENFWEVGGCVADFRRALREHELRRPGRWNPARRRWQRFLIPSKYAHRVRAWRNPDYWWQVEGDIHVWPGDHIEWDRIQERLRSLGNEVLWTEDYLVYHATYPLEVYAAHRDSCSDMRTLVARRVAFDAGEGFGRRARITRGDRR